MNHYLLEIGLEEVPAQMILPAAKQLKTLATQALENSRLEHEGLEVYSTPRRLGLLVRGLPMQQPDTVQEIKGPPVEMGRYADGNWSRAAEGFAKKNGIAAEELVTMNMQGRDFLAVRREIKGRPTAEVLAEIAPGLISGINFPKNMRWAHYKTRYIRPIRWLLSLFNQTHIPIQLETAQSGTSTCGHRFLHPTPQELPQAQDYVEMLRSLCVEADFERRKESIRQQVQRLEQEHSCKVVLEEELLEEVTNLVEWPTVFMGAFETEFLEVPEPVLVITMAKHQRYFPVYDQNGALQAHYIGVRNGDEKHLDNVIKGNNNVLRARLSDARFFFLEDQKHSFDYYHQKAEQVVFFQGRGSVAQRVDRLRQLAKAFGQKLGFSAQQLQTAQRIAELSKFDLGTGLVYEFPELQGVMGERYAQLKGEPTAVSQGIREHYHPRFAGDAPPQDDEAVVVALADKMDMLITAFSLGIIPTGSADPYALRRMAQGVIQILMDKQLAVSPMSLAQSALQVLVDQQQPEKLNQNKLLEDLGQFFLLRQRHMLQEKGVRYDLIEALLKGGLEQPSYHLQLAERLKSSLDSEAFKLAVEAVVRAVNIVNKQGAGLQGDPVEAAMAEAEEIQLWQQVKLLTTECTLTEMVDQLFVLQQPITQFFDKVLVNDPDQQKRNNRLLLCKRIAEWSLAKIDLREIVFGQ